MLYVKSNRIESFLKNKKIMDLEANSTAIDDLWTVSDRRYKSNFIDF